MLFDTLALILVLVTLPGSIYLTLLTLSALPSPQRRRRQADREPRVAFVVPAHNEEAGLSRTLLSLRTQARIFPGTRVVVVADNCTDNTAQTARQIGVEVLERQDAAQRGKGFALAHAFKHIDNVDWFIVIDADSSVDPGFLSAMRTAMKQSPDALQCRYLVRDAMQTPKRRFTELALAGWNVVRPRGRANLGWSCGILGNGFALSRQTLDKLPYEAHSIVEDLEYHLMLIDAGMKVSWVDDATVRGDMPESDDGHETQRSRWEGGRLMMLREQALPLLRQVLRGHLRMLNPLGDLLLLPLAQHVALLCLAGVLAWLLGAGMAQALVLFGLSVTTLHVLVAIVIGQLPAQIFLDLMRVPAYIFFKLKLTSRIIKFSHRSSEWVRTARDPS